MDSQLAKRNGQRLRPTASSWRMDETYIKVKGKWVYYYEDGQIKSEENYTAGERDGKYVWYGEDGQIEIESTYKEEQQKLERANSNSLEMVHLLPDLDHETLTLVPTLLNKNSMANLSVSVYDDNNIINEASFIVKDGLPIKIKTTNVEAWSPSNPKLYDIKLTINDIDGAPIDSVKSYTGFRNFNFKISRAIHSIYK